METLYDEKDWNIKRGWHDNYAFSIFAMWLHSPILALLTLILCLSLQTIILQLHHRSPVFTATSSCCLSSCQTHQCHSPSGRSQPVVMTPLTSTLSSQHCWPLRHHLSYTNTDQHNCQQFVVESAIDRLHQRFETQGPNISSQINHIIGLYCCFCGFGFCVLGTA